MDRQQLQRHVDELRQELDRLPADAGALLDCIRGAAPRRDQSRAAE